MSGKPTTPANSDRLVQARKTACGAVQWTIRLGSTGVVGAVWCPWRAESVRTPPMLAAIELSSRPAVGDVVRTWRRARRITREGTVVLNPREDLLVPAVNPGLRDSFMETIRALLDDGNAVALTTRGGLAENAPLVALAGRFGDRLTVRIGIFGGSIDDDLRWEPGLPGRGARLDLAERLVAVGARVEIELGPIIPFVNDDPRQWRGLVRAIARAGVERVVPRFLAGTPALPAQIEGELTPSAGRMVKGWLSRGPDDEWAGSRDRRPMLRMEPMMKKGDHVRVLPEHVRAPRLARLKASVEGTPVSIGTCACFDMGNAHVCFSAPSRRVSPQLSLFAAERDTL